VISSDLAIRVNDTGPGIATPFEQLDSGADGNRSGIGRLGYG